MPRADHLSPGGVKLLQEKQIAILSTAMRDGSPHSTPAWVDVEPDRWILPSGVGVDDLV
jgi:hypothetical protein